MSTDYRPGDAQPDPTRQGRSYPPGERPAVLVRHAETGQWHPGRLHAWLPTLPAPAWRAVVAYHTGTGLQRYRVVPAEDVQQDPDEAARVAAVAERYGRQQP